MYLDSTNNKIYYFTTWLEGLSFHNRQYPFAERDSGNNTLPSHGDTWSKAEQRLH